jgi:hypothetical protein
MTIGRLAAGAEWRAASSDSEARSIFGRSDTSTNRTSVADKSGAQVAATDSCP